MFYELLRVYRIDGVEKANTYLREHNERGEVVFQHIERLLDQYRAEIDVYEAEVEQFVGGNVALVKELFLQGKSPMASPEEYRLTVTKARQLDYMRNLLEKMARGERL